VERILYEESERLKNLLYAYSSIRVPNEPLEDYFDFYNQFIFYVLKKNTEGLNLETINNEIKKDFNFILPAHIIRFVLEKLQTKGLVLMVGNLYKLNQEMTSTIENTYNFIEAKKNVETLISDIARYFYK